jgi:Prolyl oligopeptidase family
MPSPLRCARSSPRRAEADTIPNQGVDDRPATDGIPTAHQQSLRLVSCRRSGSAGQVGPFERRGLDRVQASGPQYGLLPALEADVPHGHVGSSAPVPPTPGRGDPARGHRPLGQGAVKLRRGAVPPHVGGYGHAGHDHPRPHVAELRGAIVHSGCYNRTLTPTASNTNSEAAGPSPDVYHAFSPLLFADRLDRPVLIVHGTDDPNPPTQPEQAVDLYRAILATGGHARSVLLPHEGHAFLFQKSHQALVRAHVRWLRRCGGGGTRGPACRGLPVPAASLNPIGSAWSGRATGRGGARPRPCGG